MIPVNIQKKKYERQKIDDLLLICFFPEIVVLFCFFPLKLIRTSFLFSLCSIQFRFSSFPDAILFYDSIYFVCISFCMYFSPMPVHSFSICFVCCSFSLIYIPYCLCAYCVCHLFGWLISLRLKFDSADSESVLKMPRL